MPPQALVFYTSLFRDGAGDSFVPHEVVERVSAAANAPTYGLLDQYVGRGIVGGNLYSVSTHGAETAKLELRVLAGTEAMGPQVYEVPIQKLIFDWRQLQRWGIPESKLPAGSEIRFGNQANGINTKDKSWWSPPRSWRRLCSSAGCCMRANIVAARKERAALCR